MAEAFDEDSVSLLAKSLRLGDVKTTLVDFMLGSLDTGQGAITSSIWFGPKRTDDGIAVVAHIQVDAPGGDDGRPRTGTTVSTEDTIFTAHVHVEGMWVPKSDEDAGLAAALDDEAATRLFAETTGRLNLYPYLRVTVTELCARAGLDVPPLPPMTFDLPA